MKTIMIGRLIGNFPSTILAVAAAVLFATTFQARAQSGNILINFDTAPFPTMAGPNNFFTAGVMQTYNGPNGLFNISGGVILGNPTFLASYTTNNGATPPNVYGTADFADPSLLPSITLQLNPSLDANTVSGVLFNGQTISETYTVSAYSGSSLVTQNYVTVPGDSGTNAFYNFSVSAEGPWITSVVFTTPNSGSDGWDFFVDSIDVSALNVPEPSILAVAAVGLAFLIWRKRHHLWRSAPKCAGRTAGTIMALLVLGALAVRPAMAAPTWVEQGPGPVANGQTELMGYLNVTNPVAGGINAVVVADINTIYISAVNGGVWVTRNATANPPMWTPLTDQQLPAQSIASLAMDPANTNTLFAGTGSTSNFGQDGSPGIGVARSTDGGNTWTLGGAIFIGRPVNCIAPAGGGIVLAATFNNTPAPWLNAPPIPPDNGGVYRSTDNGSTFTRLSGNGASGLPDAGVTSLVMDPSTTNRFYAASPGNGIYRSDNLGVTWNAVNTGLTGIAPSTRILLAVSKNTASVYAMIITNGNTSAAPSVNNGPILFCVFQSTNLGAAWTSMGTPPTEIFPGAQGNINGAIAADPNNTNVVFITGDRQGFGGSFGPNFPNTNGCSNYSANVFRGDSTKATIWANVVGSGAKGTSPHADSRSLTFYNGSLIYACDGGLSLLNDPNNIASNRFWSDFNGNVRPTEVHSATFDPLSQVVVSGAQDCGSEYQSMLGNIIWNEMPGQGDGSLVAVGCTNPAAGTSVRYNSQYNLGSFYRTTWNSAGAMVSMTNVQLKATSGTYSGSPITTGDPGIQADTPYVLNTINPNRMLVGTMNIYESMNQGDSLASVVSETKTGAYVGGSATKQSLASKPMSYGSLSNGVPMPDVFYVGAGTSIWHRDVLGGPITQIPSPGNNVVDVVMDPQNYQNVYILDDKSRVFASFNEGTNWTELTLNLTNFLTSVRCIELFSPTNTPVNTVLIAGGLGGVYQMRRPGGGGTIWTNLSSGLPRALFLDLHYDYVRNVLVAGALGRGAWTLTGYFRGGGSPTNALPPAPLVLAQTFTPMLPSTPPLPPQAPQPLVVAPPQIALTIQQSAGNIVLSWQSSAGNLGLEASADPSQPDSWTPVSVSVIVTNGLNTVTMPLTSQQQFYRLSSQ